MNIVIRQKQSEKEEKRQRKKQEKKTKGTKKQKGTVLPRFVGGAAYVSI